MVAPVRPFELADSSFLQEAGPRLDTSAQLTWVDLTRVADSRGAQSVFYMVTGAPRSVAQPGDEGKAVFHLRVRNTNSVYNHQDVTTKTRLLDVLPARQFREVRPWSRHRGDELEDESSRVIKYTYDRQALFDAYNRGLALDAASRRNTTGARPARAPSVTSTARGSISCWSPPSSTCSAASGAS